MIEPALFDDCIGIGAAIPTYIIILRSRVVIVMMCAITSIRAYRVVFQTGLNGHRRKV